MRANAHRWYRAILGACILSIAAITLFSFKSVHVKISESALQVDMMASVPTATSTATVNGSRTLVSSITKAPTSNDIVPDRMNYQQITAQRASSAHAEYGRPALDTILDESNNTIIGDASWLLDFGIVGYGKCGTSTMMMWLKGHPQVQAFGLELKDLLTQRPDAFVRRLYTELQPGPYQRGYKAPQDISQNHVLEYYRRYWPKTKLIVGIRHPVRWMESLYNFRVQNFRSQQAMPHPNKLIGACMKGMFHTCTNKGDFAFSLLKLGKQNHPFPRPPTDIEKKIAGRYRRARLNTTDVPHMDNPLFLFDLGQLSDADEDRKDQFRLDLTRFMGFNETLSEIPHHKPGLKHGAKAQELRDAMKIDICDDEYRPLRNRLMEHSIDASIFIRTVLLKNPTVFVSSRDHFESIMQGWMVDPCSTTNSSNLVA